jgi:hypothetical protein
MEGEDAVARKPVPSQLGFHFLLLFSANGKAVFGSDDDRRKLNDIVCEVVDDLRVRVHAHCWLNNEIEVVAETGAVAPERLIRRIAATYTSAVAGRLGRNGTLFSQSHICYEPETQAELVDIVRSMHVRPVVLDLAEDCMSYPWSSVRAYRGLEELPWLTKTTLGPLLPRSALGESEEHNGATANAAATRETPANGANNAAGNGSNAHSAPRMIADAVEAKLSRETADRSRVWMARALIAWVVTNNGIGTVDAAAARLGVDATSLEYSMRKYREIAPDLFETPLGEVLSWRWFEIASPKVRQDIANILSTIGQWPH